VGAAATEWLLRHHSQAIEWFTPAPAGSAWGLPRPLLARMLSRPGLYHTPVRNRTHFCVLGNSALSWGCARPVLPTLPHCRYRSGLERVSTADVLAAAQRRLHPQQQTVVVAGDARSLRPELKKLGLPMEDLKLPKY
jgi:hypothetical protein